MVAAVSSRNVANIRAVLGASGSGKSSLIKLELLEARPRRLIVWDPKREYGKLGLDHTWVKLAPLADSRPGRLRATAKKPAITRERALLVSQHRT